MKLLHTIMDSYHRFPIAGTSIYIYIYIYLEFILAHILFRIDAILPIYALHLDSSILS